MSKEKTVLTPAYILTWIWKNRSPLPINTDDELMKLLISFKDEVINIHNEELVISKEQTEPFFDFNSNCGFTISFVPHPIQPKGHAICYINPDDMPLKLNKEGKHE